MDICGFNWNCASQYDYLSLMRYPPPPCPPPGPRFTAPPKPGPCKYNMTSNKCHFFSDSKYNITSTDNTRSNLVILVYYLSLFCVPVVFVLQKSIPVILLSVLLGENVVCMLQLTQHTASHLVILTMEAVSWGRSAAWSTRHAMNSHAHHGLSAVSI